MDSVANEPTKDNDKPTEEEDGVPSGDIGAQEAPKEDKYGPVEAEKKEEVKQDESNKDKDKSKDMETLILVAIDIATNQSLGIFPQFNINFDKPFSQMSLTERMIVVVSLQVQVSQELAQSESEEKKLIEKLVKLLGQVVPKVQFDASTSSSGYLSHLTNHMHQILFFI